MVGTRILSFDQEKYLLHIYKKMSHELMSGSTHVLLWDLTKEMDFINRVLSDRSYSMHEDTDRLNALRGLYQYVK